jgi:aspartyl-tRNA(Asn)/glutamyl-tRNA(Gln) amidotransferase subunit C
MEEEISAELFAHLVDLAALELPPEEAEYLRGQLNRQLGVIHELAAIDLEAELPITSHGVPYTAPISPAPREDLAEPYPWPDKILAQAPESQDGYYLVPDIPHTDLS